jgi:hypothetical protein
VPSVRADRPSIVRRTAYTTITLVAITAAAILGLTLAFRPGPVVTHPVTLHSPSIVHVVPAGVILEQPSTCQANAEKQALHLMPRDTRYEWVWGDLDGKAAGETFPARRLVVLDPATPCQYTYSLVSHEWMHTAGATSGKDYHGIPRAEAVADCGNVLLYEQHRIGDLWAPYVAKIGGCTTVLDAQAMAIMQGVAS